jgi:adenylate cyclase
MESKPPTIGDVSGASSLPDRPISVPSSRDDQVLFLRQDLLPVAEALDGYCQMLVDAVSEYPDEFRQTADSMRTGAHGLYTFVREQINPDKCQVDAPQFDERWSGLRHDLGNRINQVLGYCQLMILDQEEKFFGALSEDLAKIKDLCRDGEERLRRSKEAADDQHSQTGRSTWNATDSMVDICATFRLAVEPAAILVVDDSASSRDVLVRILQRQGHTVEEASNGREALAILAEREFDLVLLDFIMPEMNGYRVLKAIKADERLWHTPVIIVSALDTIHEVVACIEVGAEDFLTKPVDLPLLRARTSACLERKRLREREFGQFFTPELARHLVRHPELLRVGREANVTILFCDIRGFSRTSERLGPSDTVNWLSNVMGVLSDCVIRHRGVLVDYVGDELMAMWGAPDEQPDHADLACLAALDILAQMPALSSHWEPVIGSTTNVGIGINTGIARVGNTGSQRKFKFGPLGNPVNLASRVQGATKYLGTNLLVTENTFRQLRGQFVTRRLCTVRVVNIERPVDLHEVLAGESSEFGTLKRQYERALEEFENQQFRVAASVLGQLLVDYPDDGPSLMLMSRVINRLLDTAEEFDPIWELTSK